MRRSSKSAKQKQPNNNPDFRPRRSPRFPDRFEKLPDELVLVILSKIHDSKTLIRCYSLCKRFASLVSTASTASLRILYPTDGRADCSQLSCSKSHCHTPISSIPGFMKVFANLNHLKVKVCRTKTIGRCSKPTIFMLKVGSDHLPLRFTMAVQFCFMYTRKPSRTLAVERVKGETDLQLLDMGPFLIQSLFRYCPKSMTSAVFSSSVVGGFSSECEGSVFLTEEQLDNLIKAPNLHEDLLKEQQNVLYRLEKTNKNCLLPEKLWILIELGQAAYTSTDVEELLNAVKDDDFDK